MDYSRKANLYDEYAHTQIGISFSLHEVVEKDYIQHLFFPLHLCYKLNNRSSFIRTARRVPVFNGASLVLQIGRLPSMERGIEYLQTAGLKAMDKQEAELVFRQR